jgi:hypothetical protein
LADAASFARSGSFMRTFRSMVAEFFLDMASRLPAPERYSIP